MSETQPIDTAARRRPTRQRRKRTSDDAAHTGVGSSAGDATSASPAREARRDTPEQLTRVSRFDLQQQMLDVPAHLKKPGWDYEYKAITVLGQPVNGSEIALWHRQGWRPVSAKDMPELCAPGYTGDTIEEAGQRLYTRPKHLTVEAQGEDYKAAEQQRLDRLRAAAGGDIKGGGGLRDIKGVVPQTLQIEVEGEVGTYHK